ncbi:Bacterial membrane flanked domain protein [Nonomuraea coxensis DSM 45129]|uniref:Bacterial membrane flanked domain protein n=1 Tax=Nonomuraea coxensis DSM 45129 TaxID=1122611 RepID=A0ABX8UAA8_9ACTN|nr:PH domain-containing protein [Nonomuraea coxensis]QYC43663.1 Bacterial membrane flanked domain protein [Nonomuraea coxensis DSM 45129]
MTDPSPRQGEFGPGEPGPPPQGPYPPPPPQGPHPPGQGPYPPMPVPVPLRLSPKVLLIDPVRMLPSLLLPLVGVLFVGGFSPRSYIWAALGVAGTVVFAVIRWATFTYELVGDRLETKRALISRSVRTIPLERIRGVDVSTPPMHRLLGLAVLKIDTGASGGNEEAGLDGVTLTEAERLKAVLLRRAAPAPPMDPAHVAHPAHAAGPVTASAAAPAEREIVRVPKRWLLYGPLSGAYLLTPFAFAGGAVGLAFQWGDELGVGRDVAWHAGEWLWERPYLLLAVAVLLVLAMPVLGGVMYAVFNWDFVLKRRDGYLVAERGLVNRRSVSLESQRVRGYEIVDGLAERWAGVVRAWAIVTGLGDSRTRGQLLPDVPRPVAYAVTGEAVGPYDAALRAHPPVARNRRLFRAIFPWAVLTLLSAVAALATGMTLWWILAVVALLLACAGIPLGLDRYASLGHGYDGARLSVRSGSLRRSQAVIERRAVVGWRLRQTWFQRRAGVLTLIAGVGAGTGGYEAIDVSEAQGVAFPTEVTPEWLTPFLGTDDS